MRLRLSAAVLALLLAGCSTNPAPGLRAQGAQGAAARASSAPAAQVALGYSLFFEPKLSGNNKMSCATCHQPQKGFSNGEATAEGITGQRGKRNTPTIYTVAHMRELFWDGRAASVEAQALGPIENPIEMNARLDDVVAKLEADPYYRRKFREVYGAGASPEGIAKAIAAFERAVTLEPMSFELSPAQRRGQAVFFGKGSCVVCHRGANFTDNNYHTLGVGLDRPDPDVGRFAISKKRFDYGSFKTPTLRNVAKTAPYMHDGSLATLDDVVEFYDRGGQDNPVTGAPEILPLGLTGAEKADLVAFLRAIDSRDNMGALSQLPDLSPTARQRR